MNSSDTGWEVDDYFALQGTPSYKTLSGHLDDACFARLEGVGGVVLSKSSRHQIIMQIWYALQDEDWRKRRQAPYLANMNKAAAQAAALASTLRADDRLAGEFRLLIQKCNGLLRAHRRDAALWPKKRGRKDDSHVDDLLTELADIYRWSGGKTTVGGGPYKRFLGSLWIELPPELRRRLTTSQARFIARAEALVPSIRARERACPS